MMNLSSGALEPLISAVLDRRERKEDSLFLDTVDLCEEPFHSTTLISADCKTE